LTTNITNLTGIDSFYDLGQFAYSETTGLFWGLILISIFVILVFNLRENGIDNAVISSGFGCFILSLLFLNLEWINLTFPVIFGLAIAGAVFYKIFSANKY